jgi:hypothetical protein
MQERVKCYECKGRGYFGVDGFDGRERVECDCDGGFVTIGLTDAELAEMDAIETLLDVEHHLSPTITVDHPGMSPRWFDRAVKRAHDAGLTIRFADNGTAYVTSASDPTVSYLVTRNECGCRGHLGHGRCLHRALWIFMVDVVTTPIAEPIAA